LALGKELFFVECQKKHSTNHLVLDKESNSGSDVKTFTIFFPNEASAYSHEKVGSMGREGITNSPPPELSASRYQSR
jgi:hypothetical protein